MVRAHEIKQIPTGIAGLIDMVKKTSSGLVSFHLVLISRRTRSSKLGFFRLRFQHSEGTKSQKQSLKYFEMVLWMWSYFYHFPSISSSNGHFKFQRSGKIIKLCLNPSKGEYFSKIFLVVIDNSNWVEF